MPSYLRFIYCGFDRFNIDIVKIKLAVVSGLNHTDVGKQAKEAYELLDKYEI